MWATNLILVSVVRAEEAHYTLENKFNQVTESLVTPHIAWAKPYAGGKTRVLIIAPRYSQREVVELAQRMDLDYTAVMTWGPGKLGGDPTAYANYENITGARYQDIVNSLSEKLKSDYDCIIIGNFSWVSLPEDLGRQILKKVEGGTGLILASNISITPEILNPQLSAPATDDEEYITSGIPFRDVQMFNQYTSPEQFKNKTLNLFQYGKGRVVVLKYQPQVNEFITPSVPDSAGVDYEYYQSLALKSILWAAKKEPNIFLRIKTPSIVSREQTPAEVLLQLESKRTTAARLDILLTIRDETGQTEKEIKVKQEVSPGVNSFPFQIPKLKSGVHYLDFILSEGGKKVNWGSDSFRVDSAININRVTLNSAVYTKGSDVSGTVILNQSAPDCSIKIEVTDTYNRVINRQELKTKADGTSVDFRFLLEEPVAIVHKVTAGLYQKEELVSEKFAVFCVPKKDWSDFALVCWDAIYSNYLGRQAYRILSDAGVDAIQVGCDNQEARLLMDNNLQVLSYTGGYRVWPKLDELIRNPCLSDPKYLKEREAEMKRMAREMVKFSPPLGYSIGNDCGLSRTDVDLCFSPYCLDDLRQYLKRIYGSLEKLNAEWSSSYSDWDQVKPITFEEAQTNGNFIPWVDHRKHMDEVFARAIALDRKAIQEIDPDARVGLDTQEVGYLYYGMNQVDFLRNNEVNVFYPSNVEDLVHDLATPRSLGGTWYGGYQHHQNEKTERSMPWRHLFYGYRAAFWFTGFGSASGGATMAGIAPDLTLFQIFKWTLEEIDELKSGTGKLILDARKQFDGMGILYTQSNVYADAVVTNLKESSYVGNLCQLNTQIKKAGYQPRFFAFDDKPGEGERLLKEGCRVLFLAQAPALSPIEVQNIKEYVAGGGILITDLRPGEMDEHGKKLSVFPLNEILGVDFAAERNIRGTEVILKDTWEGLNVDQTIGTSLDLSLKVTTGKALGKSVSKIFFPALVVGNYGKGKTIYLNFPLIQAEKILEPIFSWAGLKNRLNADNLPNPGTVSFKNGEIEYIGFLPETTRSDTTLTFYRKAHLYNLRTHQYLGETDTCQTDFNEGRAQIYALLPFKVEDVKVAVDTGKCEPGQLISYRINLRNSSSGSGNQCVRLELRDPDDKTCPWASRNIILDNGTASGSFQIPYNAENGKWKLTVKEIVSGINNLAEFTVIQQEKK